MSDDDIQALMDQGLQAHQSGDLTDAEAAYRKILDTAPGHADANHLLGVIALQVGDHQAAVELIGKTIQITSSAAAYHCNLGNALYELGRLEDAAASQSQAIVLDPDYAKAHNNLGNVRLAQERFGDAVDSFRKAVVLNPGNAEAHTTLGNTLQETGRLEDAATSHRDALEINPDYAEAHTNLGNVQKDMGRFDDAVGSFQKAIDLNPALAGAHTNLGLLLHDQGRLEDAAASHQRAIEIDPDYAEAHTNLGNTWRELGHLEDAAAAHEKALAIRPDFAKALNNLGVVQMAVTRFSNADQMEEALASLDSALTLEPDYAAAHSNMGVALMELGRCEESIASFRRAIELRPDYAEAHSNLGHLQLLMGDYRNGWVGYNWRWGSHKFITPRRQYEKPQWAGEPIGGKRLLIWSEQGIGDEIVHAGMIPDLIARGIDIIVESDARLTPLFARSFPGVTCIPKDEETQAFDFHIPSGGLGQVLRPSADSFPDPEPYLVADPGIRTALRDRYNDQGAGLLVGLAWHSDSPSVGLESSLSLSGLHPLLETPGVTFVDLQYGDTADQRTAFTGETGINIVHDEQVDQMSDLDTFAAQVADMDLVVFIDNSTAHLAGALGVPTWALLRSVPFWLWGLSREDSFWYSSMRLFRQKTVETRQTW